MCLLMMLFVPRSFPHATDKTLLAKFKQQHHSNKYFVATPVMEPAFVIWHFAGNVKYQIKVTSLIHRPEMQCVLSAFISYSSFGIFELYLLALGSAVQCSLFVRCHIASSLSLGWQDFREKNTDHMRPDIVALLRSSDRAYVRQLIGMDPIAMFRWGILRATVRGIAAFNEAGRRWAAKTAGTLMPALFCQLPMLGANSGCLLPVSVITL